MTFALTLAALRRHPVSIAFTALLVIATANLLNVSAPLALLEWLGAALLTLELWYALEPLVLQRVGRYRKPTHAERERLDAALGRSPLHILIADSTDLAAARGLRCLVIGRDLMDLLEDRALSGLLTQTVASVHSANLAGVVLVWLGTLPLVLAWCATRIFGQFGRLLALVVGTSLVVPLVIWRDGFLRWFGHVFGAGMVGLSAATLLSSGYMAAGLGLMLAWCIVPSLEAIVAWESRRVDRCADSVAIDAGFGPQLLEAIEFLVLAQPYSPSDGLLSLLCLPGASLIDRADRIRSALRVSQPDD